MSPSPAVAHPRVGRADIGLVPGRHHHHAVATLGQGQGQGAAHICKATGLGPRGDLQQKGTRLLWQLAPADTLPGKTRGPDMSQLSMGTRRTACMHACMRRCMRACMRRCMCPPACVPPPLHACPHLGRYENDVAGDPSFARKAGSFQDHASAGDGSIPMQGSGLVRGRDRCGRRRDRAAQHLRAGRTDDVKGILPYQRHLALPGRICR